MDRREFIGCLGSAAAAWPQVARAQQLPIVGYLNSGTPDAARTRVQDFLQTLAQNGFVDGRNVSLHYRWARNQYDRLPELAAELISLKPAVIIANYPTVLAVKSATVTIPILFITGGDPVKLGLVESFNRPGRNITGVSNLNSELGPKRLEILRELLPSARSFGMLFNPTNPNNETSKTLLTAAAGRLGIEIQMVPAATERDLDDVFAALAGQHVEGLVIATDAMYIANGHRLGTLAAKHSIPAIFEYPEFIAGGGLLSYGGDYRDSGRLLGGYAARILKGENPAELPVQQSTKVELVVNLKGARAMGISVPMTLLGRADEVIE